ncbi:MAG: DinB family protein [Candidatus Sulfotelmatobacter sp.]
MRKLLFTVLLSILALPASSQEKQPSDNPLSAFTKRVYGFQKGILLRSAEKMPEGNYSFKPVDTVRTYGQVIGHLADAQYLFCSKVLDEKNPEPKIEQTKTSKPDLIAALKTAFAYCDRGYDGMTDTSGGQIVKLFGTDTPKLGVLNFNNVHNMEHYGNLVTYMRIKNIVPPTSEQAAMPTPEKSDAQPKK